MAIEQTPLGRTIGTSTQTISAPNSFERMGQAMGQVGSLIAEKATALAIDDASNQALRDIEAGTTPEKLAMPLTKATQAYNESVSSIEANRMAIDAQRMIEEAYIEHTNPATFTRGTPAQFHATLEGIVQGTLENTRDSNREAVRQHLSKLSSKVSLQMLKHSIDFDNTETKKNFENDIKDQINRRRNASIAGNTELVKEIDAQINQSLGSYSTINEEIRRAMPEITKGIMDSMQIDEALHSYTNAAAHGGESQWLADFAQNKQGLDFDVWQKASQQVLALDSEQQQLKNKINAEEVKGATYGIDAGYINTPDALLEFPNLTVSQQFSLMDYMEKKQATRTKDQTNLLQAQYDIQNGRAAMVQGSTLDKMFTNSYMTLEQDLGRRATLQDMQQSIMGTNDYPASGIKGVSLNTNVPKFDSMLSAQLTSGDPVATAQAALIAESMTDTQNAPNTVKLSGQALSVAKLFSVLYTGAQDPNEVARLASNTVLNASDPEMERRTARFNKDFAHVDKNGYSNIDRIYKELFGANPRGNQTDAAYAALKTSFMTHYLDTNNVEAAKLAAKDDMRGWGTSKWFDNGFVGHSVPENEIAITKIGNAFGNQMVSNLQGFINRNEEARKNYPDYNIPVIEWADKSQTITGNESDEDKVFKKMIVGGNLPRVKVNGRESDVVLIPSQTSRLNNEINYIYGVYDQFNILHPLTDVTNTVDHVARFTPKELSQWTPLIADKQTDERIREYAVNVLRKETKKEDTAEAIQTIALFSTREQKSAYRETIAAQGSQNKELELQQIIDALRGRSQSSRAGLGAQATREMVMDAVDVGLSPDVEPTR